MKRIALAKKVDFNKKKKKKIEETSPFRGSKQKLVTLVVIEKCKVLTTRFRAPGSVRNAFYLKQELLLITMELKFDVIVTTNSEPIE